MKGIVPMAHAGAFFEQIKSILQSINDQDIIDGTRLRNDIKKEYCVLRNADGTCARIFKEYNHRSYCNVPLCKAGKDANNMTNIQ